MAAQKRTVAETAALVVERHQAMKHDGVLIDAQTAGAICAVYKALGEDNRAKFDAMPVEKAARIAWKLVARG